MLLTGDATCTRLFDGLNVRLTSVNQHHLAKKAAVDRVRWRPALDNEAGSAVWWVRNAPVLAMLAKVALLAVLSFPEQLKLAPIRPRDRYVRFAPGSQEI